MIYNIDMGPVPSTLAIYQPLVVGLGAVVLGLLANTLLEWFKHNLTIRHQRVSSRRALLAELSAALKTLNNNCEKIENSPPIIGEKLQISIREDYFALKLIDSNLGLLSGEEVYCVVEVYDYLNSWPEIMVIIGNLVRVEGHLFGVVTIKSDQISEAFAGALQDRRRVVRLAVDAIQKHIK